MDKKSKILLGIFLIAAFISITIVFYKYIVVKDIIFYTDEKAFNEALLGE